LTFIIVKSPDKNKFIMPTRGSAEWNRQQNIIRDNVVEAEPTILPELIIAEPLEDLNKSLKKKIKELTKQNEDLRRQLAHINNLLGVK